MPLPTKMTDLSISAGSNYPAGSESRALADDYLRAIQTIIRLEQSQAASVASAATVDLGAIASGNYVHITGTTTITSLGTVSAGITRTVVFDGALTLTHNATSLILPGGASIVTAVGDAAKFVSEGGGNWRCINYERANISATNYAAAGANSDITSLSALPLAIATAGTTQASALTALGAVLNGVLSKSANYPIVAADRGKLIDYTAAPYTVTLPAVSVGDGFVIGLRNSAGSGALTVGRNTANINGAAADITLAPGESCLIVCDGSGWKTAWKTTTPVTYPISVVNGGTGSSATPTVSNSPQADNIKAVKQDHGHDNVGSFVFAERQTTSQAITAGTTYAGSDLRPWGCQSDGVGGATVLASSSQANVLSGTWRALGSSAPYVGNKVVTLLQRIA